MAATTPSLSPVSSTGDKGEEGKSSTHEERGRYSRSERASSTVASFRLSVSVRQQQKERENSSERAATNPASVSSTLPSLNSGSREVEKRGGGGKGSLDQFPSAKKPAEAAYERRKKRA